MLDQEPGAMVPVGIMCPTFMPIAACPERALAVAGDHKIMLRHHLNRTMHTKRTVKEMSAFERICCLRTGYHCDLHRLVWTDVHCAV